MKSTLLYLLCGGYGKTRKRKNEALYDEQNNRYAVIVTGKDGGTHVHELVAQQDIVSAKVIIQRNTSDVDLAEELVEYGVGAETVDI